MDEARFLRIKEVADGKGISDANLVRQYLKECVTEVHKLRTELDGIHGLVATLPVDELDIALEIAGDGREGHRVINLLIWHNDNGATIKGFAAEWHDAHAVKE